MNANVMKAIIAAVALIFIGFVITGLFIAAVMGERTVYVIGGIEQDYKITVNGEEVTVPAKGHKKLSLKFGEIEVVVKDKTLGIEDQTLTMGDSFGDRLSFMKLYVLNPDRVALLYREKAFYAVEENKRKDSEIEYVIGKGLHVFDHTDYEFKELPDTIQMQEGTVLEKTVVDVANFGTDIAYRFEYIEENHGAEQALDLAKRYLRYEYYPYYAGNYIMGKTDGDGFKAILEPMLDLSPIHIPAHRYYQQEFKFAGEQAELEKIYRDRLKKDHDDPINQYLLARIMVNKTEALELLERAKMKPNIPANVYGAAARILSAHGRFDDALADIKKGYDMEPGNSQYYQLYVQGLVMTGQIDAAMALVKGKLKETPLDYYENERMVYLYAQKNDRKGASQYIKRILVAYKKDAEGKPIPNIERFFKNSYCIYFNSMKNYTHKEEGPDPYYEFYIHLYENDYPKAMQAYKRMEDPDYRTHMIMYILLMAAGSEKEAQPYMAAALKSFPDQQSDLVVLGKMLENTKPPTRKQLDNVVTDTNVIPCFLVMLGYRHPEAKAMCFERARLLNKEKYLPYFFIKTMLDK